MERERERERPPPHVIWLLLFIIKKNPIVVFEDKNLKRHRETTKIKSAREMASKVTCVLD